MNSRQPICSLKRLKSLRLCLIMGSLLSTLFSLNTYAQLSGAEKEYINQNPLSMNLVIVPEKVVAGSVVEVIVELKLDSHYHAYQDRFDFKALRPSNLNLKKFTVAPMVEFFDSLTKKNKKGLKGNGEIKALVEFPSDLPLGNLEVEFQAMYQACTTKHCLFPKKVSLSTIVEVITPGGAVDSANAAKNSQSITDLSFEQASSMGLLMTFIFVFIAGILTSLTPCVYPMIPITLAVLGSKQADSHLKAFALSFTYVMGIAMMFSTLGVFAATTGALFGAALGHPAVIIGIATLFVLMALSMFGLFEVHVPQWMQKKLGKGKKHSQYLSAFITGIVAGIIAAPCVGPVVVAILAHVAKSQDIIYGFSLLFVYSLGIGVLFLLIGTFSQFLNRLPKAGNWMIGVKYFFGIILLAAAYYYVNPLLVKHYGFPSITKIFVTTSDNKPQQKIKFVKYTEKDYQQALADHKPIIIDFWAEWCAACKELEEITYVHPDVVKEANNFVFFQFDATTESEEIKKLRTKYNILGLPTVVFISPKGEFKKELTLTGFEEAPAFLARMKKLISPPKVE